MLISTSNILPTCAVLFVTIMMTVVNFSMVFIFVFVLPCTQYWFIPLIYLVWYYYDRGTPYKGGRITKWVRRWTIWKYLAAYFPIKLHKTADLDPSKNYIFSFHPHGMFVFGGFCNFCTTATGFDELFPGLTTHFLVLNGQFKFPLYRDLVIAAGIGSPDRDSIDYKLTKLGPGHSVWLAVGGAQEVLFFDHDKYKLKLLNRKGFIRRALVTGASVVPVFSFGEQRVYKIRNHKKYSFAWFLQRFAKFMSNLELPVEVEGQRPWFWFFIPRKSPINSVVGKPIDLCELKGHKNGNQPSKELVDECHQIYMDSLRSLYDEHKARFGDQDIPLVFV